MKLRCVLLFLLSCFAYTSSYAKIISIGVLSQANPLSQESLKQREFWQKTALYLNQKISEHSFVVRPLGLECLTHAINKKQLDFAITNPAQIVELEKTEGVAVISSLQSYFKGKAYGRYGALLITQSSRKDLSLLSDLKNQSVMAVSPTEFGGYQIIWRELLQAGITPENDFFNLLFTNGSQENIVHAVLNEETDVGVVRTGVLEGLIEQKKINPLMIKVIHPGVIESYKLQHTSILYPEWSFIRLEHTSIVLAKKISTVLKLMPKSNTESVQFIPYYGWSKKEDFTTVHGLLRALKLPPYEPVKKITLAQVLTEYGLVIILTISLLLILAIATLRVVRVNRKFATSQLELAEHRDSLERQIMERTQQLSLVNQKLEQDIIAREKVETTLRQSRTTLQGFYEIAVNPELNQKEKLAKLIQLGRLHYKMDAAFLFKIEALQNQNDFIVCTFDGDLSYQDEVVTCLTEKIGIKPFEETGSVQQCSSNRIIGQSVIVDGQPHCILCFIGQNPINLPEVDMELLRLMSQWIGASIERQAIEEERTKYQNQLGQATRLFTAGELASGLAHEINQPLTAAVNYVSGSIRRLKENETASVELGLKKSLENLSRATDIIRRLREFVQTGMPHQEQFDLAKVVTRVLDSVDSEAKQQNIELNPSASQKNCLVVGDLVQIEQVMFNLIRNALEATPSSGSVSVFLVENETTVEVEVCDTGDGVNDEELETVFDAFHTTKQQGMGLGLAICRSIIEAHKSKLKVKNTLNGAMFYFELRRGDAE